GDHVADHLVQAVRRAQLPLAGERGEIALHQPVPGLLVVGAAPRHGVFANIRRLEREDPENIRLSGGGWPDVSVGMPYPPSCYLLAKRGTPRIPGLVGRGIVRPGGGGTGERPGGERPDGDADRP